ncbi:minor capsid protein 10 [Rhodospirillum rubrum F11]|uniref:Minor capsid protein 10 n=1 Tax=Rhodospirillum rubrum (strain ATCC 11170 / ATH 1.1.1 / DSM 467 / LMG 4362 / NCIMB 8255 / S1) TaxID=269796 RepID=Q2RP37_RHORT|nr:phage capsid protein [Rhodospirillum rubrum]ABC24108.1 minor capsid protein 10 [Rhodospirillum rubrum ATCC 11170]AEO49855.1 minor capsid protein 10 [Rhodospirillum rubrum F11]MBK5955819.1 capsid protein [Rhodospirillum rubrum]QXG80049.1 capsid protein [Rhodospirillum rubrum]
MSNANPSRLGMVNGTGADDALFLKVFGGEVLTTFAENNVFLPLTMSRTITSGKSAQFPVLGKNTAYYHVPGAELNGNNILNAERVITVDGLLVSPVFIAKIDEAKTHYDVRSQYTSECGASLSNQADRTISQVLINAARSTATITGGFGGTKLVDAAFGTDGDKLAAGIFGIAQTFDEKDVPETDRYAAVRPAQYYLMVAGTKVLNRDWGGSGSYMDGKVLKVAGVSIVKSNHIPKSVITGSAQAAYDGDFTKTVAVGFHKSAVGTVKLLDLQTEGEYQIQRQGTLIVAKYAMGHGVLRPEAAVELASA